MQLARGFAILAAVMAYATSYADLSIGDKAPELKVTDWVKGTPVELGTGKPVVVEFWATWCGPCKQSIPHLTELAKKYAGKVDFVGVSVYESDPADYKVKVPQFVKDFGDKMDYHVATEGPDTFMANHWMEAAGERGIPAAFLVNGDGKIAWIGHPMSGLDESIGSLLDSKLDMVKLRSERDSAKAVEAEQMKTQIAMQKKTAPIRVALKAKDYPAALAAIDQAVAADPKMEENLAAVKVRVLVLGKLPGLSKYLGALGAKQFAQNPQFLNNVIWTVVEKPGASNKDGYLAAAKLGDKMYKLTPNEPNLTDTYALALFRAGKVGQAIAMQTQAVDAAAANSQFDATTLKEMRARLAEYSAK